MAKFEKTFVSPERQKAAFEKQMEDLNVAFRQSVHDLGRDNRKGTRRYQFEVDFAYIVNEFKYAPLVYMPKLIEKMEQVVTSVRSLKEKRAA